MKKIICLAILAIVFTFSAFAVNIGTADELLTLMNTPSMWSEDYTLTGNINLAEATLELAQSPIGAEETPYSGVFDGAGYEISNINLSGDTRIALFGYAKGATIKNLTVSGNVNCSGEGAAGILAVGRDEVTVEKCHNKCNVTGLQYVGGIAAYFRGSDAADVAEPKMVISECMNSGTVTSLDSAQSDAGGIVGITWGVGAVKNCLNMGLVTTGEVAPTRAYLGGIVGRTYSYAYIYNCYNAVAPTTVSTNLKYVRGITGYPQTKKTSNNFFAAELGMSDANSGSEYSADKFDALNTYTVWVNAENPYLVCFYTDPEVPDVPDEPEVPEEPAITLDSAISTADQLLTLMNYPHLWSADYVLVNNINLADATVELAQSPIGTEETPYSGVFDGAGYEISNINLSGDSRVALFGYAKGATIKNLTVSGNVHSNGTVTAGILAYGKDAVTIEKCHNKCNVSGLQYIGGIAAYFRGNDADDGNEPKMVISECINSGTITCLDTTQSDVGGIVGILWSVGAVRNCLNTGRVTTAEVAPTRAYIGGICGRAFTYGHIYNCYNAVAPTSAATSGYIRGITGFPHAKNAANNFFAAGLGMSDANSGSEYSASKFSILNVYGVWVDKDAPKLAAFYSCEHGKTEQKVIAPSTCDVKGSAKEFCAICFAELGTVELPLDENAHTAYSFVCVDNAYKYICEKCYTAVDNINGSLAVIPVSISDNKDGTVTLVLNIKADTPVIAAAFEVVAPSGTTLVNAVSDIVSDSGFSFASGTEYANPYRMSLISNSMVADTLDTNVTLTYAVAEVDKDYSFEICTPEFYNEKGEAIFAAPFCAVVNVADSTVYVAQIGDVKYATLAGAFEAASEGDTITLLEKITVNGTETWNLSGKTLVLAEVQGNYALVVKGNLTIEGGKFVSNGEYGIGVTGMIIINDGTFTSEHPESYLIGTWGNTIINDGTFKSVYNNVNGFAGKLAINGGDFTVNGYTGEYDSADILAEENVATVYGGTFSTDPSAFVAEGYEVAVTDGVYGIVQKEEPIIGDYAVQPMSIDTSDAVEVYRNTFDNVDSLNDFTQYNGAWGVENGKAYVLPGQTAANAYFVYTGANEALRNLTDYVVSVDMYNVRQATGLVARCDLATCSTALHGYMGVNASCQTNGTYFFTRVTSNTEGTSATTIGSSPVIFAPGANIRLEIAMRDKIVQTTAYDLDTGILLWTRSGITDTAKSGSFGLFAYTKIMNGLDISETRFDNLVVKTLAPVSTDENFTVTSGSADTYGNDRIDILSNGTVATSNTLNMKNGTVYAQVFMPAAATKNDLQPIKNDKREDSVGIMFNMSEDGKSYYSLELFRKSYVATVTDGEITKIATNVYTRLYKTVDGTKILLEELYMEASGLGSYGTVELRAVVNGGKIYGYMNNRCYVSVTDSEPLTGTGVGVFADLSGASFANIKTSKVNVCDKADIVIWGHSHPAAWYQAADEFARYGKVVNLALGGSSTLDMQNVVDEMATYSPKVAVIMIGSNNMSYTVEKNVFDLDNGFDMLRELCPGIKFILITEWWQPARLETYGDYVLELNEGYRAYAAENDDVVIVEGWDIPVKDGVLDESMFKDTQHLTPASYRILNERMHVALGNIFVTDRGDIDGDGLITIKDVMFVISSVVNDKAYYLMADVNFDGKIGLVDAIKILKLVVGE